MKNLRTIIFTGALSTVGALGIASAVAVPVASAARITGSGTAAPAPSSTVTIVQSHTAAPTAPVAVSVTTTATSSSSTIPKSILNSGLEAPPLNPRCEGLGLTPAELDVCDGQYSTSSGIVLTSSGRVIW
jgi:hypothetical protein